MVWVCQSGVWVVLVNIVISYCVSVGSSYVIGSEGINLTRDGQEVLELRIDIQQQSWVFNLELEARSARVWIVGDEGELTKTKNALISHLLPLHLCQK